MARTSVLAALASGLALVACSTGAPPTLENAGDSLVARIEEVPAFGTNPGRLKMFVHAPADLAPEETPALVVVLHGCSQQAADAAQTGWNELADAHRFVVVYPEQQTSNSFLRCFAWSPGLGSADDVVRGGGENESIRQMVAHASKAHHVDPARVYVAGLSAGAGMAMVLAATWPDVFAGAASFAGIPFDCSASLGDVSTCMSPGKDRTATDWGDRVRKAFPAHEGAWPRISIWTGTSDFTVSPKNRVQIARQWTNVHGLLESDAVVDTVEGQRHTSWSDPSGEVLVESYEIAGMGHGVPVAPAAGCGKAGSFAIDKGICGARLVAHRFGLLPR